MVFLLSCSIHSFIHSLKTNNGFKLTIQVQSLAWCFLARGCVHRGGHGGGEKHSPRVPPTHGHLHGNSLRRHAWEVWETQASPRLGRCVPQPGAALLIRPLHLGEQIRRLIAVLFTSVSRRPQGHRVQEQMPPGEPSHDWHQRERGLPLPQHLGSSRQQRHRKCWKADVAFEFFSKNTP